MKRPSFVLLLVAGLLLVGCSPIPPRPVPAVPPATTVAAATATPTQPSPQAAAVGTTPPGGPAGTPAGVATPQTGQRVWHDQDALPVDPSVRQGKLDNGLTYIIRKNSEPKNRAELRLVVNAGSTLEDEDQRGLAHFLEHMLFKGTHRFPKQDLVNFLESIGMRFGPDINAYTSFDETVYELRIPLDDPKVTSKAFDVLVDWAGYATIDQAEVDSERGVIVEEHRLRELNASARLRDQVFPLLLGNSRYAQRLPIGDMNIVQHASADTIRRFYQTWYRPDLMAVIAVGDFDAAQIENLVRQKFAELPAAKSPTPRPAYTVPDFKGTRYLVASDPENPDTTLEVYFRQPVHESVTAGEYRDDLRRSLFYSMLNERYLQISRQADAPFVGAYAGTDTLVRVAGANIVAAQVQEQNILPGLDRLLTEIERVRRYGFTQPELDRAQANLLEFYRRAASERDTTDSLQLTEEYIRHFLTGETIPGIAVEDALARQYIPTITLADVNREIAGLTGEDNRAVVVTAPQKQGFTPPTEQDVQGVVAAVAARQIAPYAEQAGATQLMSSLPEPARIISETTMPELGVTDLKLANGVRVLLKPTDFNQEEVQFTGIGPGGASLVEDQDYAGARLISGIVGQSGVAGFTQTELERLLTGKTVDVRPEINELSQGIGGSAAPRDLETAFQLIYLYVTQPRVDPNAVESIKSAARAMLANRELAPDSAMQDALSELSTGGSIRGKAVLPLSEIEKIDVNRAFAFYKERFANMGQFTFVFVGKFDVAQVKTLAQRYLGTLPATGQVDRWQDRLPVPVEGVQERDVYKGQDQRAVAQIVYHGAVAVTPENETRLGLLRRILNIVLRQELREALSGTYAPSASEHVTRLPKPQYSVAINFTADPARVQELVKAAFAQVDLLRTQGPAADTLAKAKEQEKRVYEDALQQNDYWLGTLANYAFDPGHEDPAAGLKADAVIDKMTAADIQAAAQEYLRNDQYIKVVLYPESARPARPVVLASETNR